MASSPNNLSPPNSIDAEKAVLGAILNSPQTMLVEVLGQEEMRPEFFFQDVHRKIFSDMLDFEANQKAFDPMDIADRLEKHGQSNSYVHELLAAAPVTLNINHYADIVRRKYYLRRIIHACQDTATRAMTVDADVSSFIGEVEKEFLEISKSQERQGGLVSARDALVPTLEEIERRLTSSGETTGVGSGFNDLDRFTGGWQRSDLVILAARPGMGKTALALNWLLNAVKQDESRSVAIFTLEMSKEQLVERLISAEGRIDSTQLRKGTLSEDEQDRLMGAARFIHGLGSRLMIDETPGISLLELRSRCRRFKKEKGLDLIVIDYLQLMSGSAVAQKQSREREISEISMGLKSLAKELSVPVIALAQLNRGPDARPDKRPKISDLRESGSMEQDADQILFVYRDDYYHADSDSAGKAEVLVSKNRHGETGSLFLAWQPNYVSFFNLVKD